MRPPLILQCAPSRLETRNKEQGTHERYLVRATTRQAPLFGHASGRRPTRTEVGIRAFGHFVAHADADGGPGTAALPTRDTRMHHSFSMHASSWLWLWSPSSPIDSSGSQVRQANAICACRTSSWEAGLRESGVQVIDPPESGRPPTTASGPAGRCDARMEDGVDPSCVAPASRQSPTACNISRLSSLEYSLNVHGQIHRSQAASCAPPACSDLQAFRLRPHRATSEINQIAVAASQERGTAHTQAAPEH